MAHDLYLSPVVLAPYVVAFLFVTAVLACACRGEPVPRDYQNAPPAMTHPADSPEEAPSPPTTTVDAQPSYGAEGTSAPYQPTTDVTPAPEPAQKKQLPPNSVVKPAKKKG